MAEAAQRAYRPARVHAFLATLLTVAIGALGTAPTSAATSTYASAACVYGAPPMLDQRAGTHDQAE